MMLARTPPLSSPQGTYQYYVDGHSEQVFSDGDLWHAYEMDENRNFITYFGSETAITTTYLEGHTAPVMGTTDTREDVDNKAGLPTSEENRPAKQTIGFDIDCLDLCVDGFTLEPGDSAEYVFAVSIHEGGEAAVETAREINTTVESLWNNIPQLSPDAESNEVISDNSGGGAGTSFIPNPNLEIISAGIGVSGFVVAGYASWRYLSADDTAAGETTDTSTATDSTVRLYWRIRRRDA